MAKPKIMTVYGTRPEAIKVAPVIKTLGLDDRFDSVSVSTGQHREMLDQVNQMFEITPDYDLGLMKKVSTLSGVVSMALSGLDEIIDKEKPDVIISQGDTSTAMSAALAGFHREVKIVHLEAGLRTGNISSPFPEEANRRIIGQVASLHLAPTETSLQEAPSEFLKADLMPSSNIIRVTGQSGDISNAVNGKHLRRNFRITDKPECSQYNCAQYVQYGHNRFCASAGVAG